MCLEQTRDRQRTRQIAVAFIGLSIVALMAGVNRLWPPALLLGPVANVLRWRETLAMVLFTPLLVLLLWRLYTLAADGKLDAWAAVFVAGVYFIGLGIGMHDTTDLLGRVFADAPARLRVSLRFFDNRLGHWLFFAGFILTSLSTGVQQLRQPLHGRMSRLCTGVFLLLSVPLLLVMLTNLMFEKTGVDLTVIAVTVVLTIAAHSRYGRLPLRRLPILCVLYPAYGGAVAGTLLWWLLHSAR